MGSGGCARTAARSIFGVWHCPLRLISQLLIDEAFLLVEARKIALQACDELAASGEGRKETAVGIEGGANDHLRGPHITEGQTS